MFKKMTFYFSVLIFFIVAQSSWAFEQVTTPSNNRNSEINTLATAEAQVLSFGSAYERVNFLELYTSEGCSSCPPADAWLAKFKTHPELWQRYVPISFHVNYWDWIGWKDPFATKDNSKRQGVYLKHGQLSGVYTPGLVLNGKEWRTQQGFPKPDAALPLQVKVKLETGEVNVEYGDRNEKPESMQKKLVAHVALLGFDIAVDVKRGENKNKTLKHDFVLLTHQQQVFRGKALDKKQWQFKLDKRSHPYTNRFALAVWVTADKNPRPVQATGAWLPEINN